MASNEDTREIQTPDRPRFVPKKSELFNHLKIASFVWGPIIAVLLFIWGVTDKTLLWGKVEIASVQRVEQLDERLKSFEQRQQSDRAQMKLQTTLLIKSSEFLSEQEKANIIGQLFDETTPIDYTALNQKLFSRIFTGYRPTP